MDTLPDADFIIPEEEHPRTAQPPAELTGWETVVFVVGDAEDG